MDDFGADYGIQMFLTHIFGRWVSRVMGFMPWVMLVVFCAIYTPIAINMLRSAFGSEESPPY